MKTSQLFRWIEDQTLGFHNFRQPSELAAIESSRVNKLLIGSNRFVDTWRSLDPNLVVLGITNDRLQMSMWDSS